MSAPKIRWDGTVNISIVITLAVGILAFGSFQASVAHLAAKSADHEQRIRELESHTVVLARIDERLNNIEKQLGVK